MKKADYLLLTVAVVAAAASIRYWKFTGNPDALHQAVLQRCLPHQLQQRNSAPCAEVEPNARYMVSKGRNGPLQYLLVPTWRIDGTESPLLLKSDTSNFFWLAWQARSFMSQKYGQEIPDKAVSLTVNSHSGRTQNHLHIHISCLRTDVREQLGGNLAKINTRWLPLPGGLHGHECLARRVMENELARRSPFMMLAEEVPDACEHASNYALTMVRQSDESFVLLATQHSPLALDLASAEEIQDHQCDILR